MAAIALTEQDLFELKKALIKAKPGVRSSHLTEAVAAALGFRTNASLRADLSAFHVDPPIVLLDDKSFDRRLQELGYRAAPMFRFEGIRDSGLISTQDPRGSDIKYKGERARAWRNLMVCAVNEALRIELFSLRPNDNRWRGDEREGCLFDFALPNGLPARGYVGDIGHAELSIHVAINPNGDLVRAGNGGFHAGDAFAAGWLERKRGAWLQSATSLFNCRRKLLKPLALIIVEPKGYGDRGGVIM